jgi:hypothetical protein
LFVPSDTICTRGLTAEDSSGDSTLEAIEAGARAVAAQPADEHFLFVVSDANLRRYGISTRSVRWVSRQACRLLIAWTHGPEQLAEALKTDSRVRAYVIFIGSLADEADRIRCDSAAAHSSGC